ncbi:chromosome segregation SMC family protein [Enterovirga aerilata]|uniref:Chromosome partition protein Smc n=1 Tax=Enterovirga aerilata TaxID=2730920 RepID=A0A849IAH5_9HYPH|nr:AAA family ATPase [Enterovirga sp. DB1703]NNM73007.1 AAA family ATPase [Enterovirga sp. DB1703]
MKLTRLRIVGFKTFVEPTEVLIEPGLTGVVGPNGCGKSNLVEALRWVMGESSHKNMRAAGMDDVIFAGSGTRAARNTAEVLLAIDNTDRAAPAAFNDTDALEVSRRIEREQGSSYHVNGREVRARDVQLLFADAASGARSPALVRQGQISELINAKPQARRRILEDAAGIAGLHARRHEAELRLKHADENLLRVEDVLREIDAQAEGLRRQGRQAQRYRTLSAEIRRLEARLQAVAWRSAERDALAAEAEARADLNAVAEATATQAEAAKRQAVAAHELQPLREAEAAAAAALRRLSGARHELEHEERRAKEKLADLERRIREIEADIARQAGVQHDAAATIARLGAEAAEIARAAEDAGSRREALAARQAEAEAMLAEAEARLAAAQAEAADLTARRQALEAARRDGLDRAARAARQREEVERDLARLGSGPDGPSLDDLRAALAGAEAALREAEEAAASARAGLAPAREEEARRRAAANEADRSAGRVETELRTLAKLFAPSSGRWPSLLDRVTAEPGFETALAAALGDDLEASPDPAAPVHWTESGDGAGDPDLPDGVPALAARVSAPAAMARRLRQIGIVAREDGARLAPWLRPGQRLVSPEGDLWRWDGLTAAAEAPSAAARRLAEKNRLADLERSAQTARAAADAQKVELAAASARLQELVAGEAAALDRARRARAGFDAARDALARAEKRDLEAAARRSALDEALARIDAAVEEAAAQFAEAEARLAALPESREAETRLLEARAAAAEARAAAADARAALGALTREAELTAKRRTALAADIKLWTERAERAGHAATELAGRLSSSQAEHAELASAPDTFLMRRRALTSEIQAAEARRSEAADRLARAETSLAEADRAARAALDTLSAARERRAASEVRAQAAAARLAELTRLIVEAFEMDPAGLMQLAELAEGDAGADLPAVEARLATLKADRERLGGINLRAEEELAETEGKRSQLAAERDDLVEAIRRLRGAIGTLNREGRERLVAAFGTVNAHFGRLFTRLFGGGEAELTLIDSDDPLEAGLEILARPPGKKPASLSLLSGGEQALTATALIFAVFLTNPSPICVLDEVDAPLDDANVERYCDLLREMASETETRFLVITHNPITMARMDRLFGVTMAERGVSQLVSVDLGVAEQLREAS